MRVLHVVCSDENLHRRRLKTRRHTVSGFREASWPDVQRTAEEFEPWPEATLVVDSVEPLDENAERCVAYLIG